MPDTIRFSEGREEPVDQAIALVLRYMHRVPEREIPVRTEKNFKQAKERLRIPESSGINAGLIVRDVTAVLDAPPKFAPAPPEAPMRVSSWFDAGMPHIERRLMVPEHEEAR